MFDSFTLGSYVHGNSFLHRLDPRTKILGALLLISGSLIAGNLEMYVIYSIVSVMLLYISGLPPGRFFRGLRFIYFIMLLGFLVQSFTLPGQVLFYVGNFTVTIEGMQSGALLCWYLIIIVIISSLVTYTTTSNSLSQGVEKLLSPISRIGFPVNQLAMMMGVAISFIPIMSGEVRSLVIAQQSRGARFGDRNLIRQFKNLFPLLLPVIANILRRADELSEAMEARCYRPGVKRTSIKEFSFKQRDWIVLALSLALLLLTAMLKYYCW